MKLAQISIFMVVAYLITGILNSTLTANLTSSGMTTGNIIFDLLLQPYNWNDQTFWLVVGAMGVAAAALFISTLVLTKSDIAALAPLAGAFLLFATYMMSNIYAFLLNAVVGWVPACTKDTGCYEANIIVGLIMGVVGIYYFFAVLEWWAWRQTSSH